MRRRWSEERRNNQQQAEWIVAWLRENGPATIRQIVGCLLYTSPSPRDRG